MDWKEGIDENCAFEIEETIINNIKAGFLSDDEILEECTEDLEYDYPEDADKLTEDVLSVVIKDIFLFSFCQQFSKIFLN